MRSRSALDKNFGLAAAASASRLALRISSMLGGCFFCDAHPFLIFFFCTSDGPSSSSGGGGGGGGASEGGGGGGPFVSGGGGGGYVGYVVVFMVQWRVQRGESYLYSYATRSLE